MSYDVVRVGGEGVESVALNSLLSLWNFEGISPSPLCCEVNRGMPAGQRG